MVLGPVTLNVEDRSSVKEVQALDEKPVSFSFDEPDERKADGIGPRGRIEGKNSKQRQLFQLESSPQKSARFYLQRSNLFRSQTVEINQNKKVRITVNPLKACLELTVNFQFSLQGAFFSDFGVAAFRVCVRVSARVRLASP